MYCKSCKKRAHFKKYWKSQWRWSKKEKFLCESCGREFEFTGWRATLCVSLNIALIGYICTWAIPHAANPKHLPLKELPFSGWLVIIVSLLVVLGYFIAGYPLVSWMFWTTYEKKKKKASKSDQSKPQEKKL